jgi:hypothetical protein
MPAEDQEFNINYFSRISNLTYSNKPLYFYRIRQGSITHTDKYVPLHKLLNSTNSIYKTLYALETIKDFIVLHYINIYGSYLGNIYSIDLSKKERIEILSSIRNDYKLKNYNKHKFSIKLPRKHRFIKTIFETNPMISDLVLKLYFLYREGKK